MRQYEITFQSVNSEDRPKPITALVIAPNALGSNTGAMLCTHGWGGNRFRTQDVMEYAADQFNLICISVEYRQSGFDFDPVGGLGASVPYDASFYQVFDVLNGLRSVLELVPSINRERLFHYGSSQGGHIALLSAIFAPHTFALVYATSPVTHLDESIRHWAGREFAQYELTIRNVIELAHHINCPVLLDHGTDDEVVSCDTHTRALAEKLQAAGKKVSVEYYEGAGHDLEPVTDRLHAFKAMASDAIRHRRINTIDDFAAARKIDIPCSPKTLRIDWSKSMESTELFSWR